VASIAYSPVLRLPLAPGLQSCGKRSHPDAAPSHWLREQSTGHFTAHLEERSQLETVIREHGLALIVDEVFLDYPLRRRGASFASAIPDPDFCAERA